MIDELLCKDRAHCDRVRLLRACSGADSRLSCASGDVGRTTERTADAARPKPRGRECGQAPEHDAVRNAIATRQYAGEAPRRHADDEQPRPPP